MTLYNTSKTDSLNWDIKYYIYTVTYSTQVQLLCPETVKLPIEEDVLNLESTPLTLDVESPSKSTVT
jgi:hypothetical protein